MSRPEHHNPPELFYNEAEASKYTTNSRIMAVQREMSQRCIEMLLFKRHERALVLDIGCGSGLSGDALAEAGHAWVGLDVSPDMLDIAVGRGCGSGGGEEGGCGEVLLADMGQGFGFRAGTFDGAISVSALQWLCYSDRKDHRSAARLSAFFAALYRALRRGARAALQFYPESESQLELITTSALRCGFTGGLVVDFPNSKKTKKYYLCLIAGGSSSREGGGASLPTPRLGAAGTHMEDEGMEGGEEGEEDEEDEEEDEEDEGEDGEDGEDGEEEEEGGSGKGGAKGLVPFEKRRGEGGAAVAEKVMRRKRAKKVAPKSRTWIIAKKEGQRRRGADIRPDTKYTGRKRKPRF